MRDNGGTLDAFRGFVGLAVKGTDIDSVYSADVSGFVGSDLNPVKYRVLDKASTAFGGNTVLLDCDSTLFTAEFDSGNSYVWGTSSLRTVLNGSGFYSKEGVFSTAEKAAIAASIKSQANGTDGSGTNYHGLTN